MSRKRAVVKYTAAGIVTTMYGLAAWQSIKYPLTADNQSSKQRVAIVAVTMLGLTWTAILL